MARLIVLALMALGCAPASFDAELLQLDSLGPHEVREGGVLRVDGDGFEPGARGMLTLSGMYYRPGHPPRAVEHSFAVRALSGVRAAAHFDSSSIAALGGRGTFEGSAVMRFEAGATGTVLAGHKEEVTLDFHPAAATLADRMDEQGEALAQEAGFVYEQTALDEGLVLSETTGLAAELGLRAGDTIVSFGHVKVGAISDLVRPPDGSPVEMRVRRPEVRPLLSFVLPGTARAATEVPWRPLALLALLLLLLGAPSRSLASWCWSLRSSWASGGWMLLQCVGAAALCFLSAIHPDACMAAALAVACIFIFASPSPAQALFQLAPVFAVLFCATRTISPGGASPSTWALSAQPIALVLFVAGVAASALRFTTGRDDRQGRVLESMLRASLVAALVHSLVTADALVGGLLALVVAAWTPPLRIHAGRTLALLTVPLAVAALWLLDIRLVAPGGLDAGVLPAALVVALLVALVGTRKRPIRFAYGL